MTLWNLFFPFKRNIYTNVSEVSAAVYNVCGKTDVPAYSRPVACVVFVEFSLSLPAAKYSSARRLQRSLSTDSVCMCEIFVKGSVSELIRTLDLTMLLWIWKLNGKNSGGREVRF